MVASIALIYFDHRIVTERSSVNHLTHLERHWEGGSATSSEALRLVKDGVKLKSGHNLGAKTSQKVTAFP